MAMRRGAAVMTTPLLRLDELLHLLQHLRVVDQILILRLNRRRQHIAPKRGAVRGTSADGAGVTGTRRIGHLRSTSDINTT